MKALSVRQPWAWAIMNAGKDIENRDWPTRIRGRVAIHASKAMTKREYAEFCATHGDTLGPFSPPLPPANDLTRGGIVGTVEIIGCVKYHPSPWFVGDYGFVLRNPRQLVSPIQIRGDLGFFDLPADLTDWLLTCLP